MSEEVPDDALVLARIEIIRFFDEDRDVLIWSGLDGSGDDLALIESLGMLRLTEDTAIREAMGENTAELVDEDDDYSDG